MTGDDLDALVDRLHAAGFDHMEAESFHRSHASVFVWQSFRRSEGHAFDGRTLTEAMSNAVEWAARQRVES